MARTLRLAVALLTQSLGICASFLAAWSLRFDFAPPPARVFFVAMPMLLAIRWLTMGSFRMPLGHWRFLGVGDLKDLQWAILSGSVLFFSMAWLIGGDATIPISVYAMEAALSYLFLAGVRVHAQTLLQARDARRMGTRTEVLIVGAGAAAVQLLAALRRSNYRAVGLLDDDASKHGMKLSGVPVLSGIEQLPELARSRGVREVLIAIPSASGAQMQRISRVCALAKVAFRAVPSLTDLVEGKVAIAEFRDLDLDDLLGREPVHLDVNRVRARLSGRVAMVTGAAGSIGSELCRQILRFDVKKLVCVDRAETPLFRLQQHILAGTEIPLVYSVADFTDTRRMRELLLEHEVSVVMHAGANKHVPLTEANPYEGLQNNVFGLMDLVDVAEECGCEDFLFISTDKAVNPSSLMGCTKRIGEMIVGARPESAMRCVSVRFGNVLGSQGSVIPLFQEQIRTRRCVTVTHPQMTRYFMTIPEAVSLVLQAFTVGEHGDILVLDMGRPLRILDLARSLIELSGKKEQEIQIVYTGMRPGEKLHEELFYEAEKKLPTGIEKVMRAKGQLPQWALLTRRLHELELVHASDDGVAIRNKIKQIIPEYEWSAPETVGMELPAVKPTLVFEAQSQPV